MASNCQLCWMWSPSLQCYASPLLSAHSPSTPPPSPLPSHSYHQQPGFIASHHWPQARESATEPSQRRHPSDSPAPHMQHVPSYHQWPHTSAVSRTSSSSSMSSYGQQSFSNPRSPTGSCFSEGDVFPPPPEHSSHSLVDGFYRKPLPPAPVSMAHHPPQWHMNGAEVRRRSVADVCSLTVSQTHTLAHTLGDI